MEVDLICRIIDIIDQQDYLMKYQLEHQNVRHSGFVPNVGTQLGN